MPVVNLSREEVIERSAALPSFPVIVTQILDSIDDPDGCIKVIANFVNHDPLIAARVLSAANKASERVRRNRTVNDVQTALSLIGMTRLREIAITGGIGSFVGAMAADENGKALWRHSVAVGVACEELCMFLEDQKMAEMALIAGLLHDIGQFWLFFHNADAYTHCWSQAYQESLPLELVERQLFGVDHPTIGAWLAEHWGLPSELVAAIGAHHAPNNALRQPLVPLVHVAEVISNALSLKGYARSRVNYLSAPACRTLGIEWNDDIKEVFGRIEARSQHANAFFE